MTHPDTLVAITCARILLQEVPDTPRINHELTPIVTGADSRFIYLLDALSSLAVSTHEKQVVAMIAQREEGIMNIIIAENGVVKAGLPEYITERLVALKAITAATGPDKDALKLAFFKATMLYSFKKMQRRFTVRKWLADLETNFKDTSANGAKCIGVISSLMSVREAIDLMKPDVDKKAQDPKKWKNLDPTKAVTDEKWINLVFEMSAGVPDVDSLLADRTLCDKWADDLKAVVNVDSKPPGQKLPVPLYRAIVKLTSHFRHVLHLFSYADSVDGRADLACAIKVTGKPKDTGVPKVVIPMIPEIENLIRPILPAGTSLDHEIDIIRTGVKDSFNLVLSDTAPVTFDGTVHCECSLITMFNLEVPPIHWPVGYIGVSKLSCASCYAWIHAFNETHARKYQTGGTHGRWYAKWAMPMAKEVQTKSFKDAMDVIVKKAYRDFYDAGAKVRAIELSDSTEAKARLPGISWGTPELQRRVHLTTSERNARRGIPPVGNP